MLDIKFVRENPDIVKENIRKKFQDAKLPLVDEVLVLDKENRTIKQEVEALRAQRNKPKRNIRIQYTRRNRKGKSTDWRRRRTRRNPFRKRKRG